MRKARNERNGGLDTDFRVFGDFDRGSATDYASVWNFEYDADGRLTKERLNGQTSGTETLYPLGERKVEFDKAGRRTKQAFKSESNRRGYLALDTTQTYSYDATKKWLRQIHLGSSATEKAQCVRDEATGQRAGRRKCLAANEELADRIWIGQRACESLRDPGN
jgi:YD repeat-containing protein